MLGLRFCARAFSSCRERGPLFIVVRGPFTIAASLCCGAQAPDVQAQQLWLTGLVALRHVGSSQTRARTRVPCIGRQILNHCATREAWPWCLLTKWQASACTIVLHARDFCRSGGLMCYLFLSQPSQIQKLLLASFTEVASTGNTLHVAGPRFQPTTRLLPPSFFFLSSLPPSFPPSLPSFLLSLLSFFLILNS